MTNENKLIGIYDEQLDVQDKEILKDVEYLGSFETEPAFTMLELNERPGLIKKGSQSVKIKVYSLPLTKYNTLKYRKYYNTGIEYNHKTFTDKIIDSPYGQINVLFLDDMNLIKSHKQINTSINTHFKLN
jgi:hypothetical protein